MHTENYLGHLSRWSVWSDKAPSLDICVVVHWPIESPSGRVGHFGALQILNGRPTNWHYFLPKFVRHSQPLVIDTTPASAQRKGAITPTRPLSSLILDCTIAPFLPPPQQSDFRFLIIGNNITSKDGGMRRA